MLRGIIHPDMQQENIGFDGQNFKFIDHADVRTIDMPNELSEDIVRQLTASLFPMMKSFMKDFAYMSYFRAGFTSFGGGVGSYLILQHFKYGC